MTPDEVFQDSIRLHQAGRVEEAVALYDQLLVQFPRNADVLQFRGLADVQRGRFEAALDWFTQALSAKPDFAVALINQAAAYLGLGRYGEALFSAERGLALAPLSLAGINNKASALNRLGRPEEALAAADAALDAGLDDAAIHCHRADSLLALRRYEQLVAACDRAIALNPELPQAHSHRGHALTRLERQAEAATSFARALMIQPLSAMGHYSHALALQYSRRSADAVSACDRALSLQPAFPEALIVRATALTSLDRYEEAVADCDAVLALQPDSADAFAARGMAFKGARKFERALADFDVALDLDPDLDHIPGQRVYLCLQMHEWQEFVARAGAVLSEVDLDRAAAQPLVVVTLPSTPAQQQKAARQAFLSENPAARYAPQPARHPQGKIRVAYFSSDLHEHPVGQLMAGLLEAHDRSKLEITIFSFGGNPNDPTRRRIEKACDKFIDATHMSGAEMAALAREMNVHIAVDLNGFTANARSEAFAEGAAPIQVNYLGYSGTMGSDRIHYIIGDDLVTPVQHFPYFSEHVVTMPHCYMVGNGAKRHTPMRLSTRRDFGLPETGFIFCNFNASYKITPDAFDIWMRLLRTVEGSMLWLLDHGAAAAHNLRREARSRGIDPQRLYFAKRTPGLAYLARYRLADLFLDTFYYNAHATACEALMMGLPVVTRLGEAFAGRVGASLLKAVDLPELVASDSAEYEKIALRLASDPVVLGGLRETLKRSIAGCPLFDTNRYARNLETAYREMWRRYECGLPPKHIRVVEEVRA